MRRLSGVTEEVRDHSGVSKLAEAWGMPLATVAMPALDIPLFFVLKFAFCNGLP